MSNAAYRTPAAYADFEGDRQFATTLARGMELLRCFSPEQPVLGNKELAQMLKLPRPTVSRLVYTLVAMGYLAQDLDSGRYRLGSAVLSLGYPLLETLSVRQRARPAMLELAQEVGGSVAIAIRSRLEMVCVEVARRGERTGHPIDVGLTYSLCGSAVGRAYLAGCGAAERESLLNQVRVKLPQEWERHQERLQHNLSEYASRGCCVSVGELYGDVQAVAVPLGRVDRGELAVLNCSFQKRRLDEAWLVEQVGPQLVRLARRLN
ncbi:IclR family transcriptional regulator [Ramlibacter rhizophilus]|uniref:IclR family transcriptional regulator n=1 Tax=Ramlibacter rhizophilus TaxID=1781167 RepID=A0A4Z0BI76_9BURK|nr:IclR family transcriptional regulator [Ramlibacter rhizophilus]TFY97967.1 IclR family transcriptional regulator [Ramlibacter rhizophilus]